MSDAAASYPQLSSSDPVMPTLSPQPPVVKDEAYFQTDEEQRGSPQGVALKGKISDEVCYCLCGYYCINVCVNVVITLLRGLILTGNLGSVGQSEF